jgi:hypothetical protein
MRRVLAMTVVSLVLVTGVLPPHRCTPAEGAGTTTVLLGSHAHDGHDATPGHEGCEHEHGLPGDVPCCVDEPADPTAPPARAGFDVAAPATVVARLAAPGTAARLLEPKPTWHVPIPRAPTETVVLLR